ncbi:LysR substrate-binding domain-containing protein [Vibrio nomapromontoriensis]|uniref:LysR substrate-binding domain-containing protein n=1 Tax=Vibrio nomapromontoriensis TaxID=2910246 RepID=UPI003D13E278
MANEQTLLRNLHTFNVAAKTLSFTIAAKELHLTQGAVSHRIKVLEKSLGFNLFTRGTRKLGLTDEGARFYQTLSKSLNTIFGEIEDIKSTEMSGEITVASSPYFASSWLVPRLKDFKRRYPNFNVNILVHEEQQQFQKDQVDIAFYYGDQKPADCFVKPLFGERYIPVCTPEYAQQWDLFDRGVDGLKDVNLLHALGSNVWERWVKHHQYDIDIFNSFYCVSHRGLDLTGALNSLGLAMGRYYFVQDHIKRGELVCPYPAMNTDQTYDLVCLSGHEERPKVRTFINWIDSQL